jgi:hypothetical protein
LLEEVGDGGLIESWEESVGKEVVRLYINKLKAQN